MIPIMCLVQQGGIEPSVSGVLKTDLMELAQRAFDEESEIAWIEVGKGNGFTEAKPSTSSLVSIQANRPLPQGERIAIMKNICDFWMQRTSCSINEIVAAVSDPVSQGD